MFLLLNHGVDALQRATDAGTGFVFGYLGGGPLPFAENAARARASSSPSARCRWCWSSARSPRCCSIGACCSRIVKAFAWVLRRTIGIGGALGLGAAVHIFVGHIEAPLLIRPYLLRMARGELFALMSCGMAGIAGTVMVLYASILGPVIPDALGNILIASVISTPAALAVAALMVPFQPDADAEAQLSIGDPPLISMDAIAKGTGDGIVFLANIIAMLVVHRAASRSSTWRCPGCPRSAASPHAAAALRLCLPSGDVAHRHSRRDDIAAASHLMGTKTVLNEFIAYVDLAKLPADALEPAYAAHHDLCDVRLRQFRQPRHHDRRHGRDGAGAQARDRRPRPALDPFRHARHLHERRGGGDDLLA